MGFLKQLLNYLLYNIILFVVYYVLTTLSTALLSVFGATDYGTTATVIISFILWCAFNALYLVSAFDRDKYGLAYLAGGEKATLVPSAAFNPLSEAKNGRFDFLAYCIFCLPLGLYGMLFGYSLSGEPIINEIFMPQTVFLRLTGSSVWGYILSVAFFYVFSSYIQLKARERWLSVPLSKEERDRLGLDVPGEEELSAPSVTDEKDD